MVNSEQLSLHAHCSSKRKRKKKKKKTKMKKNKETKNKVGIKNRINRIFKWSVGANTILMEATQRETE